MRLTGSNLRCWRGGREVFRHLEFAVSEGSALAVVGPNGAGKSSLLRLVAGLLRPAGGAITLDGGAAETTVGEQAHYLGHLDPVKPSLTVSENLAFWAAYLGAARPGARPPTSQADALETVGLAGVADLPGGYLSAGQRRRLSIARLLAVPRPLWLLDEPTAALDAAAQAMLAALMQAHLSGGGIVMAATHGPLGLAEADQLSLGGAA